MRGISQCVVNADETESVTVSRAIAPPLDLDQSALDAAESVDNAPIEQFAFFGQNGAARGPVEQPNAEMFLELPKHPAHCRLGDIQFGCGSGEAAVARRGIEDEQRIAGRQHPAEVMA